MTAAGPPLDCQDPVLHPGMIGIRRVEVSDDPPALTVTLVPADAVRRAPSVLDGRSYTLTGGVRLFPHVLDAQPVHDHPDQVVLPLDGAGDFSVYTLTLSGDAVDPFFASHKLRFRLGCEGDFDCRPPGPAEPAPADQGVAIDYLAKDYASFRQALLDFVPTRLPQWTERSEADLGIAVLDLLAATGDTLSYIQDRVANEAFISSATQRRSVQGHLALVGYEVDEGAAAHTFLHFEVLQRHRLPPDRFRVATDPAAGPGQVVFETLGPRTLFPEQNAISLYDFGNVRAGSAPCCLDRGSLSARLAGAIASLRAGDHLLFTDTETGVSDLVQLVADADTAPAPESYGLLDGYGAAVPTTLVRWSPRTPLTHDYCVPRTVVRGNLVLATHGETVEESHLVPGTASRLPAQSAVVVPPSGAPGTTFRVSVFGFAPGEAVAYTVADPGGRAVNSATVPQSAAGGIEGLPVESRVGDPAGIWSATFTGLESKLVAKASWHVTERAEAATGRRPRLRVRLEQPGLTWVDSRVLALGRAPSAASTRPQPRSVPQVALTVDGEPWALLPTLLESGPADDVYRIETDDDGTATLVFGRGGEGGSEEAAFGRRPPDGSELKIRYRVGRGSAGNVGVGTLLTPLDHTDPDWFLAVSNPVAATGGREPETRDHARRVGPPSMEKRLVAVTAADYQEAADGFTDESGERVLARVQAGFTWTGSWLTVRLGAEPITGEDLPAEQAAALLDFLQGRRLAGYDLEVTGAGYLPLQLELLVCAAPGFLAENVKQGVQRVLGAGLLGRGRPAFFNPRNFAFGQPVALSRLHEAVSSVPGVASVSVVTLAPLHSARPQDDTKTVRDKGFLVVAPDRIARLDADPDLPEHGRLRVRVEGGL